MQVQADRMRAGAIRGGRVPGGAGDMRVLILHSRYLTGAASGENRVVEDEARLLRQGGHSVTVWDPSPDATVGAALARTAGSAAWSAHAGAPAVRLIPGRNAQTAPRPNLFP